ncbi:MAG TPA: LysR family transcriptional regulator [Burkholderiaceae bacterium]|nr:LysR family transcriptional regulator [Burkholderiaceae bacterium]
MQIDPELRSFATPRQLEYLDAIEKHGSQQKAAAALGVSRRTVDRGMVALKQAAALRGYSPEHNLTHIVPSPFAMKGYSQYWNPDGTPGGHWIKTNVDQQQLMAMQQAVKEAFFEDSPALPAPEGPKLPDNDIIPWIQIGDAHIGLLTHIAEVNESFDLKIAERELCAAISILVDELPECERLVINDLGDATHYQDFTATSESGHSFDFDTRYPKMIKVYSRTMRFIIDKALTKAQHVDVIVNQGNHSRSNDIWMAELLKVAYGHTGRVHVLNNDSVFIGYRMGNTLVMTHHSDKCRPKDLANVMTTDFRKDYGETQFHYIDIGHIHHAMVLKEHPGIVVEAFNHLATTDKWAHDNGYRSRKCITVIKRSRTYGEIGRRLLPVEEIRARIGKAAGGKVTQGREVYAV